jgi:hypothetical protein
MMAMKNKTTNLTQSITNTPLSQINFYYNGVTVYYDSDRENCNCGSICRCQRIINTKIKEINVFDVTKTIINNYKQKLNEIDHYCINRVLTILKVWDPDNWDINVSSGYYGEEIQSVELKYGIAADIEDQLNQRLTKRYSLRC